MPYLETCGNLLFRTRNYLFPILLLGTMLLWPPLPTATAWGAVLLGVGLVLIGLGQALRMVTIGLDYIKRGGRKGRIHARRLVTGGIFGHCRNPMYAGNVAVASGFFCVSGNPYAVLVGVPASVFIYAAIIYSEECYLARAFGEAYTRYCNDVPRWLPTPRGLAATLAAHRFDWSAVIVREYGTFFSNAMITLAVLGAKAARSGTPVSVAGRYGAAALVLAVLYGVARYLKLSKRLSARNG